MRNTPVARTFVTLPDAALTPQETHAANDAAPATEPPRPTRHSVTGEAMEAYQHAQSLPAQSTARKAAFNQAAHALREAYEVVHRGALMNEVRSPEFSDKNRAALFEELIDSDRQSADERYRGRRSADALFGPCRPSAEVLKELESELDNPSLALTERLQSGARLAHIYEGLDDVERSAHFLKRAIDCVPTTPFIWENAHRA